MFIRFTANANGFRIGDIVDVDEDTAAALHEVSVPADLADFTEPAPDPVPEAAAGALLGVASDDGGEFDFEPEA